MERPIIFSPEMVRAILDGKKTMTRRIVKPQPFLDDMGFWCYKKSWGNMPPNDDPIFGVVCPYGFIDDILWVREKWSKIWDDEPCYCDEEDMPYCPHTFHYEYQADDLNVKYPGHWDDAIDPKSDLDHAVWKPSIHMPKQACRIKLRITEVRVERLQDITDEESLQEGMLPNQNIFRQYELKQAFQMTWEKIHGKGAWESNPWVWVIEFEKL